MTNSWRRLLTVLLVVSLTACASAPKVALRADAKQSVKRIALAEIPEPKAYAMNPGPMPGGAAFYVFGAIGGAVLGGIEANRYESATSRFHYAVSPSKPELSAVLMDRLEAGLKDKGFNVVRVAAPPKTADGKGYDFKAIDSEVDGILITALEAGYAVESGPVTPRIIVGASLHAKSSGQALFSDRYLYSTTKFGDLVLVQSDSKYTMPSLDAVYQNMDTIVEGLKTGTGKLAERILVDL